MSSLRQWWQAARIAANYMNARRKMHPDTAKFPMVTCRECGSTVQATYVGDTRDEMVECSLCFTCLFWTKYADSKNEPGHFVYKGQHYIVGSEDAKGERGSYGRKYAIYHKGGRTITTNLWHQGIVPERFRERLPDNCTIMEVPNERT